MLLLLTGVGTVIIKMLQFFKFFKSFVKSIFELEICLEETSFVLSIFKDNSLILLLLISKPITFF